MVDDAFGIAGRPRGVIKGDGLPLVGWPHPTVIGVAAGDERLVIHRPDPVAARPLAIGDVDHQGRVVHAGQGGGDGRRELGVGEQHLGLAMAKDEADVFSVETGVKSVDHRAGHRNAKRRFERFGRVLGHHRDRVAKADAMLCQGRAQAPAAVGGRRPIITPGAVDDRRPGRKHRRCPVQEGHRRHRHEIGRVGAKVLGIGIDRHVKRPCCLVLRISV